MNPHVFVFVPFDGSRQDFDSRLRDCLAALEIPQAKESAGPTNARRAEELPLWTWFVPNRAPGS